MSLINIYKDYNITLHDCLLKHTTEDLDVFEVDEVTKTLKIGYTSKDPNAIKIATLINAIFTHHAQTFMLTRRSFGDLIKQDNHSVYNSINSTEYKLILNLMINTKHFKCLRKPKGRKSGVYKAIHPDLVVNLLLLHGKEWFEIQEKKICEYYDEKENTNVDDKSASQRIRENLKNKGIDI